MHAQVLQNADAQLASSQALAASKWSSVWKRSASLPQLVQPAARFRANSCAQPPRTLQHLIAICMLMLCPLNFIVVL